MPVERTMICPARCRMGAITPEERATVRARSPISGKYDEAVNRESAYESISRRAGAVGEPARPSAAPKPPAREKASAPEKEPTARGGGALGDLLWGSGRRQGMVETLAKQAARSVGGQLGRQIVRGVLGGILGSSRR